MTTVIGENTPMLTNLCRPKRAVVVAVFCSIFLFEAGFGLYYAHSEFVKKGYHEAFDPFARGVRYLIPPGQEYCDEAVTIFFLFKPLVRMTSKMRAVPQALASVIFVNSGANPPYAA